VLPRAVDAKLVAGRRADEWIRDAVSLTAGTHPHPNPRVGCIVLSAGGDVLARSAHTGPGYSHAETAALSAAGGAAAGGTVIVTLEPCSHQGLTPPCAPAVIASGVTTVIAGPEDPDQRVAGNGFAMLRDAGIRVISGVATTDVIAADPGYFHHRRTGRPLVTLKYAATVDGQVAAADGSSRWITSPEAREDAHRLRAEADAVMIGAGTLRADDPMLTVRFPGYDGPQPLPVVVAGRRALPSGAALYQRRPLIYRPERHGDEPADAEVVAAWSPEGADLGAVLKDLGGRGILDLLVEGGPSLARSMLVAGLVDRLVVYTGALLAGGSGLAPFSGIFPTMAAARRLVLDDVTRVGPDLRVAYHLEDGS
jgi:diaminohydroxyphosphoribosylaminopyrimidine deaminase / 5-amino-6-(5-phosphoribosylamino)uracil reductase